MAKIPHKPPRSAGLVQRRIAGRPDDGGIGRVGRITNDARDVERGRGLRRRRKTRSQRADSGRGRSRRGQGVLLRRWLVLVLVATGLTIGVTITWTLVRHVAPPAEQGEATGSRIASLESDAAVALVSRALAARTEEELAPVALPGETPAAEVLRRFGELREQAGGNPQPNWLGSFDSIAVPLDFLMLRKNSGLPLMIPLTPDSDERWRIDVDAMMAHCSPAFGKWVEGEVESGLVRVLGREDFYYNGPFRNDAVWACFALTHPEHDTAIYGYCLRESPSHQALQAILLRNRRATATQGTDGLRPEIIRVTLRMRKPPQGFARQYEIAEVVSDDWVIGEHSLETILHGRASSS